MLEIFEILESHDRQILTGKEEVRQYRRETKIVVDRLPFLSGDEKGAKARRGRIRSFLISVPVLTLKDGIQRMGGSFSK